MPLGRERSQGRAARREEQAAAELCSLPLSPHRGGYVGLKSQGGVFAACRGISPLGRLGRMAALPGSGLSWRGRPEPPVQRGNPRWALRGTFGTKLLRGFFHLHKLCLIRPDNFRNSQRLAGGFSSASSSRTHLVKYPVRKGSYGVLRC